MKVRVWVDGEGGEEGEGEGVEKRNVPLPFDHFFFCFLPADAAAGAYVRYQLDCLTIPP